MVVGTIVPCSLELLWLIFAGLIELTMFRRIRAMAGLSIVSGSMSCSDRTQSVCLWQFGMLAAPGCQLPMAAKERKAPSMLGFCRKALRIGWVLGIVRSPAGNKQKIVSKRVVKGQSARIIRVLGREADLFTRQAAIIGDQSLQNQTH